jgi:hypothetical protein
LRALAEQPWLATLWGTLGDRLQPEARWPEGARLLLGWALARLRPDQLASLRDIPPQAWTEHTAWRPLLALACQHGLQAVPDLPAVYRRRTGEAVADNLCGLWAVGPSTLYRYLDKARRQLVDLLAQAEPEGEQLLSLRLYAHLSLSVQGESPTPAWHIAQAREALLRDAAADALWHQWQAGLFDDFVRTLRNHTLALAGGTEVDALLLRMRQQSLHPAARFELLFAEAPLWRYRRSDERELQALQAALRAADELGSPLTLGRANAALALFDQSRDPERAISRFEVSIEQLRAALDAAEGAGHQLALGEYAHSLVHLAWLHLRRNDPKAKPLLASVVRLREELGLPDAARAFLELALGEQCRCEGQMDQALAHRHRALLLYEQLGDRRAVINCHNNLCLLYAQTGEFTKALAYGQRVLDAAQRFPVEPELVGNAHGNLGLAHLHADSFDEAICEFLASESIYALLGMRRHLVTVHLNLAETYFKRFKAMDAADDEAAGDHHAALAKALSEELNLPSLVEATTGLKRRILGSTPEVVKPLPTEHAAHPRESAELDRLRNDLALPRPAAQRARTHLAIARQYLLIAAKEREAARALIAKHNVPDDLSAEFDALRQAWERELTREQALATLWREKLGDLMSDAQRRAVVAHVLAEGAISKSGYASVAQVSPATASKHLGLLAERGLLAQVGNGPSTRYVLPTD